MLEERAPGGALAVLAAVEDGAARLEHPGAVGERHGPVVAAQQRVEACAV